MEITRVPGSLPPQPVSPEAQLTPAQLQERRELIHAVQAANNSGIMGQNSELTFTFDRESRRPLLRIVDRKTGELIRQIPAEEVLAMLRHKG